MSQSCVACGMPMDKPGDHAGGDESTDYCVHCARPDGSMQSYEEKLESMTAFIVRSEGLQEGLAKEKAREWLAWQPAWQGRGDG